MQLWGFKLRPFMDDVRGSHVDYVIGSTQNIAMNGYERQDSVVGHMAEC